MQKSICLMHYYFSSTIETSRDSFSEISALQCSRLLMHRQTKLKARFWPGGGKRTISRSWRVLQAPPQRDSGQASGAKTLHFMQYKSSKGDNTRVSWKYRPQGELNTQGASEIENLKFYEFYYTVKFANCFYEFKTESHELSICGVDIRGDLQLFDCGSETCRGGRKPQTQRKTCSSNHPWPRRHHPQRLGTTLIDANVVFFWSVYCPSICFTCFRAVVLRASRMLIVRHKLPFQQQLVYGSL